MRSITAFIIFCLLPLFLFADTALESFVKKDYKAAENTLISELVKKGGDDPLLLYNLGVTCEKQNEKGLAAYYYLQSIQAAPGFTEARNNLDIILKEEGLKVPKILMEEGDGPLYTVILFFVFLYIFVAALIVYMFRPGWKLRVSLLPAFMLMLLFTVLFFIKYRDFRAESYAVTIVSRELKSGPDEALSTVGKIKAGEILEIKNISGDWVKAKSFQDNIEGWANSSDLRFVARKFN